MCKKNLVKGTLGVLLGLGLLLAACENGAAPETSKKPDDGGGITQPTKPAIPADLTAGLVTENAISVSWSSVSGAEKYKVYAGTVAGSLTLRASPAETNYVLTALIANTTYYIEVSAENAAGEGDRCPAITATTNNSVKPAAPTGLTVGTVTETSVALSWNTANGAANYKVFAGTSAAGMTLRGSPTAANFTITDLAANTTYYIAVAAQTATNESDQSPPITALTKPPAPTGLAAGTATSNSIAITWTAIGGVTGYKVYAGTTDAGMTLQGSPTTATYTVTGLTANTNYYIAVAASNASGEGSRSSAIQKSTILPAPGGVIATPQAASSSIQVSWNAVSGASSYNVYRASPLSTSTYTLIGNTPSAPYNDTGRTVSVAYYYKVSAVTSGNVEGEQSAYASATITASTKDITSFQFADFSVNGTINGTNITVTVPNIVNLTTLAPTIVHNGKSVSPASGVAQDFSSSIQYTVTAEDNTTKNYTVTVNVTSTTLTSALTWLNSNATSSRTYTVVVQANESLTPKTITPVYSGVNIILKGGTTEKTISLSSNGSLFTVSYVTLTLDNNITLEGRSANNASLVTLNNLSAKLVMNAGSKIINNTLSKNDSAYGGGVTVQRGEFTMNGGTISGNKADATTSTSGYSSTVQAKGGGVYVDTSGIFTMNDGTITGNTAYSEKFATAGGGVFVNSGTFTMKGGTISNNTSDSRAQASSPYSYGGGIAAWTNGTFTMQGGTISGNQAVSSTVWGTTHYYGGGVYVANDKFTKTGGTINGSDASTTLRNVAKDRDVSNLGTTSGHAAYADVGSSSLKRNNTAGTTVSLDSSKTGTSGGWE